MWYTLKSDGPPVAAAAPQASSTIVPCTTPLQSGSYNDDHDGRFLLSIERSSPLFIPENTSVLEAARRMIAVSCTAAVVHKAGDTRAQQFLYGLVTLSDM